MLSSPLGSIFNSHFSFFRFLLSLSLPILAAVVSSTVVPFPVDFFVSSPFLSFSLLSSLFLVTLRHVSRSITVFLIILGRVSSIEARLFELLCSIRCFIHLSHLSFSLFFSSSTSGDFSALALSLAFSRIRAKWIIFFSRRASHFLPFRTLFRLAVTRDARARALSLCATVDAKFILLTDY